MITKPTPIEQSDPELGELLKEHCNSGFKKHGKRVNSNSPIIVEKPIGRNDPCLCNSGKKFKKCCGRK